MKKALSILIVLLLAIAMTSVSLAEGSAIEPLPHGYDLNQLGSCSPLVTVDRYDPASNTLTVSLYSQDLFDVIDAISLKQGDTITVSGRVIPVSTVENSENGIEINGGFDAESDDSLTLAGGEGGTYYVMAYNDRPVCTLVGTVSFPVAEDLVFIDNSDPDAEQAKILTASDLISRIEETTDENGFNALSYLNCVLRFEDGKPVELEYLYTPWN